MKAITAVAGFTLLEVLIAALILSTGLLLVIEGMGRSQHGLRVADHLIRGSLIAEDQFTKSQIELRQFHKLSGGSDQGTEAMPGKSFNWKKMVRAYHHETVKDETKLNYVEVQTDWNDGPSGKGNLNLSSLLLNREKKR